MSQLSIRRALEAGLAAMLPALSTAYENVPFKPVSGTPYQKVAFLFAQPDNPTYGDSFHRERGYMQVTLFYPQQVGSKDAATRAELIRSTFFRGASFTSGGVTAVVERTPEISSGSNDGDRWMLPVKVRFFANVSA